MAATMLSRYSNVGLADCDGPFKDGEKYVEWSALQKEVALDKLNEREAYYIGFYTADRGGL